MVNVVTLYLSDVSISTDWSSLLHIHSMNINAEGGGGGGGGGTHNIYPTLLFSNK